MNIITPTYYTTQKLQEVNSTQQTDATVIAMSFLCTIVNEMKWDILP